MLQDQNGNVFDLRNRKERRMAKKNHHNLYTKKYPSRRSYMRTKLWLYDLNTSVKKEKGDSSEKDKS